MNDAERKEFSQEIAIFISAFAAEVRDLKKTIGTNSKAPSSNGKAPISDASKEEISHKEDISTYLLEVCHCHSLIYVATINFTTSCTSTV
jgi:hypothetical protein